MHDYGGWMWLLIDVILVAILAASLIYGIGMWRQRHRDRVTEQVRDEATDRLYHKEQ
jgi:type II secretory pathway pseudopilin PulG